MASFIAFFVSLQSSLLPGAMKEVILEGLAEGKSAAAPRVGALMVCCTGGPGLAQSKYVKF